MYQTKSQFKKGYQHNFNMIRNKKGELAMNTKQGAAIWREYFDKQEIEKLMKLKQKNLL